MLYCLLCWVLRTYLTTLGPVITLTLLLQPSRFYSFSLIFDTIITLPTLLFSNLPIHASMLCVLVRPSIAVKRHHDYDNTYKENSLIYVTYIYRDLVQYHHGATWCLQADMVWMKELRILQRDSQVTGSGLNVPLSEA